MDDCVSHGELRGCHEITGLLLPLLSLSYARWAQLPLLS